MTTSCGLICHLTLVFDLATCLVHFVMITALGHLVRRVITVGDEKHRRVTCPISILEIFEFSVRRVNPTPGATI